MTEVEARGQIEDELEKLQALKADIAARINRLYPVGTRLLVNLRHGQKTPTVVTVFCAREPWSHRPAGVNARLDPSSRKPLGHRVDVSLSNIVGYA